MNPETGTTTQGESVEEALANLREATKLFLEEMCEYSKIGDMIAERLKTCDAKNNSS